MNARRFIQKRRVAVLLGLAVASVQCGRGASTHLGSSAGSSSAAGAAAHAGSAGNAFGAAGSAAAGTSSVGSGGLGGSTALTAGGGSGGGGTAGSTGGGTAGGAGGGGMAGSTGAGGSGPYGSANYSGTVFYVTHGDGTLYAIEEGTWAALGMWTGLPITDGIRGIDADPQTGVIYFTHGGSGPNSNGAPTLTGSLGAWNVYTNSLVYDVQLTHGVDQPSYGEGVVYVPSGEYTDDRNWYYYNAADGALIGNEPGGMNPHDTIWKNSHRYYGGTEDTYLYVLGLPIEKVGPSPSDTAGVRPFTVNGDETRAYITWSHYRGFSVGDLTTGSIIKSVNFGEVTCPLVPSHGMSLSPDNSEVYVLDTCIDQLKAYTATDDPQLIAAIPLLHPIAPGDEEPCAWDCTKDGWIMHSRDGKYVYVGDSGDVVDTATHQMATYLEPLANCRHGFLELVWQNGVVVDTSTHVGLGY